MEGMEISYDGFSIRGYTLEMRSKDVSKCCPFSSKKSDNLIQDVVVQDFLPEITVKKFRWWAHELQALGSNSNHASSSTPPLLNQETAPGLLVNGNARLEGEEGEKSELVCPVCGVFAAATVTVVNAHITSCISQSTEKERWQMEMRNSKSKLKSPKKRSITEIFAAAPQIETVEDIDEEEDDDEDEELHWGKRGSLDHGVSAKKKSTASAHVNKKSTVRKKKMRRIKKAKLEKSATLMKIKRRKKKLLNKGLPAKKENEYKLKLQTPVRRVRKLKGRSHSKRPLMDAGDGISTDCNQKSELEPKGNKRKVRKSESVPNPKNGEVLHGILKKNHHPKSTSEKTSTICNNEDGVGVTYWGDAEVLPSKRHVRFSDKHDILGSEVRNSSSSGKRLLNLFLDAATAPLTTDNSAGRNDKREKVNIVEEANQCCCSVSSKTDKRHLVIQPACENEQFSKCSEHVTMLTLLKPHMNHEKTMHLALNSGSENEVAAVNNYPRIDKGKMAAMNSTPYADYPQSSMASQHGKDSFMNYPPCATYPGSYYSGVNLSDCVVDSTYSMSSLDPRMNRRSYMQPSAAFSVLNENERHVSRPFTEDDNYHAPQCCQLSQFFSLAKMDNFCPSVDWSTNRGAAFRQSRGNEKSFCLPLNSHGELIRFSSSDNLAYGHEELSTLSGPSSSGLPVNLVLPSSQEYLRTRESNVPGIALTRCTENPIPNYPARLGVTEPQVSERANAHWSLLNTGRSLANNSFDEHQNDQIRNQQGNRMIHMKNRLDFSPVSTGQPTMRLMGKDVAICSNGDLQPVTEKVQIELESRRMVSRRETVSGSSLLKRTSQENKHFSLSARTPTPPISQASHVNCREGTHSMLLSYDPESRFTHFLLNPHANALCQRSNLHLGRSYLDPLDHSPGCYPVVDREADIRLPFMSESKHRELRPHLQVPPTFGGTGQNTHVSSGELVHKNLPPAKSAYDFSLAHRGHGAPSLATSPCFRNQTEHEHAPMAFPCLTRMPSIKQDMHGSSFLTRPPVYHHPTEFPHPLNPMNPHLQMKSSLVPDSFVHTPCFTTLPGVDASVPTTMCREKNIVMDRMLDFGSIKDHDLFPRSRKRPPTNIDHASAKPTKIPNLAIQDLSNFTVLPLESSRAIEPNQASGVDENGRVGFLYETQNFRTTVHAGFDPWSPYGLVRSGIMEKSKD